MEISQYDLLLLSLMIIMTISFLWQLYTKGIHISGIIGVIAAVIFFGLNVYHNDIDALAIILFTGGVILVVLELFIIGAVLGILGFICIVISFLLTGDSIAMMTLFLAICLVIGIVEWVMIVKFFKKKIPFLSEVVLRDSTNKESGYTSHDDRSHLLKQVARTVTELRPSGIITINDTRIDAVSEGAFIKRDVDVVITYIEGTRVVVREIRKGE